MTSTINKLNNQQKELCAVIAMRSMHKDYSIKTEITFDEALFQLANDIHHI